MQDFKYYRKKNAKILSKRWIKGKLKQLNVNNKKIIINFYKNFNKYYKYKIMRKN